MIKIVFRNEDFQEPNIGAMFVIHKPEDVGQRPGWNHGMDIYDNAIITITGHCGDPSIMGKSVGVPLSNIVSLVATSKH